MITDNSDAFGKMVKIRNNTKRTHAMLMHTYVRIE